jgi:predicted lipoprotein with Yx(FWY)xxD motif
MTVHKDWKIAALTRNFNPPNVGVANLVAYGDTLTLNDMTLYTGVLSAKRWGGRNTRDGFRNTWSRGMRLGTAACGDDKCLTDWKPFAAPADAQPRGFWQVYERPDGTKQWAYKGYAVWVHAKDEKPGDHRGQLTFDYGKLGGNAETLERMWFLDQTGGDRAYGGAGIYWAIARP